MSHVGTGRPLSRLRFVGLSIKQYAVRIQFPGQREEFAGFFDSATSHFGDANVARIKRTLGRLRLLFECAEHSRMPVVSLPMWDLHSHVASNGTYTATIEEEQTPYLRIEAQGYESVETQIQLTNGLGVVRDFALQRHSVTNSIRGIVRRPDGSRRWESKWLSAPCKRESCSTEPPLSRAQWET